MYFLSDEQRTDLVRGLLPRARHADIPSDLRGWHWWEPPMQPSLDILLGVWEIASPYCSTNRDIYLRRVRGEASASNMQMKRGKFLQRCGSSLIESTKRLMYVNGVPGVLDRFEELTEPDESLMLQMPAHLSDVVRLEARALWRFLHRSIAVRLQEALSKQPRHTPDSLVAEVLPITIGQKFDGHRVGLSRHLCTDVLFAGGPIIVDITTASRDEARRLYAAGYALAAESVYEVPFDVGFISHIIFDGPELRLTSDVFLIDEALREEFLHLRDQKALIVADEIDPPIASRCPRECTFLPACHGLPLGSEGEPQDGGRVKSPHMKKA